MSGVAVLARAELRLLAREWGTMVFAFAFPVLLMLILAGVFGTEPSADYGGVTPAEYYVADYFAVPLAALTLIGLPTILASYRDRGVLRRFAAAGVSPGTVVAGPLFLGVSIAQAIVRDGFDLRRHAFSMLSLGDLGWLQITNFVVTGSLFLAATIDLRRCTGDGRFHRGPLLLAVFGGALIAGGVFVADPALGFPVGTADTVPETLSWHGLLHAVAFAVGMASLVAACVVWSRRFAAYGRLGWARCSMLVGVSFVVLAGVGVATFDFGVVTVAIAVGWGWASALCLAHLRGARQAGWGR